jgi:hypothetical protein
MMMIRRRSIGHCDLIFQSLSVRTEAFEASNARQRHAGRLGEIRAACVAVHASQG